MEFKQVLKNNRRYLYWGIISGFLSGFLYFAFGVYTHSSEKTHLQLNQKNFVEFQAGTTR
ncbi:Uncharacterised protein [Legionella worsleiensis]|nr:Uncharacterised protein [Legionella worsleiensis]